METLVLGALIIFSMATSLGVGSSTLAVINFFVAIADGKIDETERRMMGITYVVLRVAMIALLVSLVFTTSYSLFQVGLVAFTPTLLAKWTVLIALYANAVLMTMRIMPSTFGPAIQAGSWYTLGLLGALGAVQIDSFSYLQFVLCYISAIFLAAALINGIMAHLKHRREQKPA